jgi:hypothetical protein
MPNESARNTFPAELYEEFFVPPLLRKASIAIG